MRSFGPPSSSLRSPDFSAIRGARLTDSRILHYIKAGHYGESRRVSALAAESTKRPSKPRTASIQNAIDILNAL